MTKEAGANICVSGMTPIERRKSELAAHTRYNLKTKRIAFLTKHVTDETESG